MESMLDKLNRSIEMRKLDEHLANDMMYIIDYFIALQLQAKNLPVKERYDFIVKEYRKALADWFESNNKTHPIYLEKIRTKESGPYSETAFDINHQPNLLNL